MLHGDRSDPNVVFRNGPAFQPQFMTQASINHRGTDIGMKHGDDQKKIIQRRAALFWMP